MLARGWRRWLMTPIASSTWGWSRGQQVDLVASPGTGAGAGVLPADIWVAEAGEASRGYATCLRCG